MTATSDGPVIEFIDDDEAEQRPMTDREHRRVFGWGWDDPDDGE